VAGAEARVAGAEASSSSDEEAEAAEGRDDAVPLGRLWVSAPGTVSPLHFDATDSYLCQVRGRKRMLLWPAALLDQLRPYPPEHVLARRLQFDVTGGAPHADAHREVGAPMEVVLQPGDVLYFPAQWAHYTEALPAHVDGRLGASFSLGFRTDGRYLL